MKIKLNLPTKIAILIILATQLISCAGPAMPAAPSNEEPNASTAPMLVPVVSLPTPTKGTACTQGQELAPSGVRTPGVLWTTNNAETLLQSANPVALLLVGAGLLADDALLPVGVADDAFAIACITTGGTLLVITAQEHAEELAAYGEVLIISAQLAVLWVQNRAYMSQRVPSLITYHQTWWGSLGNMSDGQWDEWMEKALRGLGNDLVNARALDAADLYERSNDFNDFLEQTGMDIDEIIAARNNMDQVLENDVVSMDFGALIQWQDIIVGYLMDILIEEGFDEACPRALTDFLDWLLGSEVDEDGTSYGRLETPRSLEEIYTKLNDLINQLRYLKNEGDTWAVEHPLTIDFLESLLSHIIGMLGSRGIFPSADGTLQ